MIKKDNTKPLTEDQLQAELVRTVRNTYSQLRRLIWSIPNSGAGKVRDIEDQVRVNTLKATGLLEGVWDIHIFWNNQLYILETKVGTNDLTRDCIRTERGKPVKHYGQKEWGELMAEQGAIRCVYRDLQTGLAFVASILDGTACDTGL